MASREEIQRVAAAMNAHRPDWRLTSLTTFLTDRCAMKPYRTLAIAAIAIATDPKCATPNLLAQDGPWWAGAFQATGEKPPLVRPSDLPRCPTHDMQLPQSGLCSSCEAERKAAANPAAEVAAVPDEQVAVNTRWAAKIRADLRNGKHLGGDPAAGQDEQTEEEL